MSIVSINEFRADQSQNKGPGNWGVVIKTLAPELSQMGHSRYRSENGSITSSTKQKKSMGSRRERRSRRER